MKNKILGLVILIILIIAAVIMFGKKSPKINGSVHPIVNRHLKIGIIDVLSGDKAAFGENFKKGIDMAKDEYIAAHPGDSIELFYKDDGYDAKKGVAAFHELVNTVDALIVATTPTMDAIAPEASKLSIPVLGYGQGSTEEKKDSIFRLFPDPIFGDMALGLVMKSMAGSAPKSVVGVYTHDQKIVNFYNAFQESFGSDIFEFPLDPSIDGDSAKMKAFAEKIASTNPKYIFMSNYANVGSQFIKQYLALGKKPIFVFDFTLNNVLPDYEKTLGNLSILDGSLAVTTPDVDQKDFISRYQKKYGVAPGELSDYGYDALSLLLESERTGAGQWLDRLQNIKMKGVTGDFNFDENGRRIPTISVVTITHGQIPKGK